MATSRGERERVEGCRCVRSVMLGSVAPCLSVAGALQALPVFARCNIEFH